MLKKLIFIIVLAPIWALAQTDGLSSHYIFNELLFNPAAIDGFDKVNKISATAIGRQQWVGMNNAPSTQNLNIGSYWDKIHGGLGLVLLNDKLGLRHDFQARLSYAYVLKVSKKIDINFGMYAGFLNRNLSNNLILDDYSDQTAYNFVGSKNIFDVGAGVELNTRSLKVGVSSSHIHKGLKESDYTNSPRHLWSYVKYSYKVNDKIYLCPSYFLKTTISNMQHEGNLTFFYNQKFWVGASYRNSNDLIGLVGANIGQKFKVGYSYDYNMGAVSKVSSGSHEIMLSYVFRQKKREDFIQGNVRFFPG